MNRTEITILLLGLCLGLLFIQCSSESTSTQADSESTSVSKIFDLVDPSYSQVTFENKVDMKIDRSINNYDYFFNGSGVAVADINNDGLLDLFFTGNDSPNALYLNQGDFKFEDISASAGIATNQWSTGVTTVDINEDGYMDFYVCNSGPSFDKNLLANQLFVNNGDNTFTESAKKYGIANDSKSTQASFFDYDRDGDLDLMVMNHSWHLGYEFAIEFNKKMETLSKAEWKKQGCALYRNEGSGIFTDVSESAGILKPAFGLGLITTDLNDDGLIDIYVANDFYIPDFMFMNNGDGTFTDKVNNKIGHTSFFAMGCDFGDINNDGLQDFSVVDMSPSDHVRNKTLMASMDVPAFRYLAGNLGYVPQYMFNSFQLNRGGGVYSNIESMTNTSQTDWSWAPLIADFDMDGWKDYIVTNGFLRDTKDNDYRIRRTKKKDELGRALSYQEAYDLLMTTESTPLHNYGFKNNRDLTFDDVSEQWGLEATSFSNGAAYGDFDNDGDLDLVVNNLSSPAFVYRNQSSGQNYLKVKFVNHTGSIKHINARLEVEADGQKYVAEQSVTRGYQSAVTPDLHLGLGNTNKITSAKIKWADGSETTLQNSKVNTTIEVDVKKAGGSQSKPDLFQPKFKDISNFQQYAAFVHEENEYDDFAKEILLPHKQSTLGPCLVSADVNNDGLEDFYVGGAQGQSGKIYFQTAQGLFGPTTNQPWEVDKEAEDLGAAFVDFDSDGDLDLYVSSGGGAEFVGDESNLQDRLYVNNGKGFFTKSKNILPTITSSTGRICHTDYDNDRDVDLFICGRTTPGKYPQFSRSYLLENKNGKYEDVTVEVSPDLTHPGLITDATWMDYDGDKKQDLIIVGEWSNVQVFKNTGSKLEDVSSTLGLDKYQGWWYSLTAADLDNDGDQDLILGNIGKNNKFKFSKKKPLQLYSEDFDDNGSLDVVLSKSYNGNLVPVRGRECSSEQMPFITEKFESYKAFAEADIEDIYGKSKLASSQKLEANFSSSVILQNNGGSFEVIPLPPLAQIAPINDAIVYDFDKDGIMDILIGGNNFDTEPETPRYDAGKGLYLRGLGDLKYEAFSDMKSSGVFLPHNLKSLALVHLSETKIPTVIAAANDDKITFLSYIDQQAQQ